MRDAGLSQAISAVGSVSELARKIGIAQPSVSNWSRIPAERVAAGEAVTGVDRAAAAAGSLCAPNRFRDGARSIDETDLRPLAGIRAARRVARARARCRFAARVWRGCGSMPRRSALRMWRWREAASETTRPERVAANSSISSSGSAAANCCLTAPIISPASCMSARWRACATISQALGIERAEGNAEPEDHAAILCEIMAGDHRRQLSRRRKAPTPQLFEKHLAPWIGRFFADLERAEAARFLSRVGALGRLFIDIEREAFALPA